MKTLVLIGIIFITAACNSRLNEASKTNQTNTPKPNSGVNEWSFKAVSIEGKGWGYQLFKGSHLEINQQNIPAVNGLHYFESEEKAALAAEFALTKIEKGFFPPTVEPYELDSIGAINIDTIQLRNAALH